MPRDYKLYTDDILDAIAKILKYTRDMDYTSFVNDDKTIDAVVRNLEIIGEAAKNLPDEITGKLPQIEWDKIRGLRNILAHQYFGINNKIIWDVVENKLAPLRDACSSILE